MLTEEKKKRIIVHIGGNKTGSSSIQVFLAKNALLLKDYGYLVPPCDLTANGKVDGQHVWYFQNKLKSEDGIIEEFRKAFGGNSDIHTVIVSAENLFENPDAPTLLSLIQEDYEVEVYGYIRRQDQYIESAWQQWFSKSNTDFHAWLYNQLGVIANWASYIQNWERAIGAEKIHVRTYERATLIQQDVRRDFIEWIGLDKLEDRFDFSQDEQNISYSNYILDLASGNSNIFKDVHDNEFYHFIKRYTQMRYKKGSSDNLLNFEQKVAVLNRYREGNDWIRENYFPDKKGLFQAIKREPNDQSPEDSTAMQLKFMTELFYKSIRQNEHALHELKKILKESGTL